MEWESSSDSDDSGSDIPIRQFQDLSLELPFGTLDTSGSESGYFDDSDSDSDSEPEPEPESDPTSESEEMADDSEPNVPADPPPYDQVDLPLYDEIEPAPEEYWRLEQMDMTRIRFTVSRYYNQTFTTPARYGQFFCGTFFIWTLCAALAASSVDPAWTGYWYDRLSRTYMNINRSILQFYDRLIPFHRMFIVKAPVARIVIEQRDNPRNSWRIEGNMWRLWDNNDAEFIHFVRFLYQCLRETSPSVPELTHFNVMLLDDESLRPPPPDSDSDSDSSSSQG